MIYYMLYIMVYHIIYIMLYLNGEVISRSHDRLKSRISNAELA